MRSTWHKVPILKRITDRCSLHSDNSCVITDRALNSAGYPMIKVNGRSELVHRVVYSLYTGVILSTPYYHVSHLCHNKICVNFDHLVYEPSCINMQRKQCVSQGKCVNHGKYETCLL